MPSKSRSPRCAWAETHELFIPYHDEEWGEPNHDDRSLFEMLCLEGAQAGLSWLTILKKRDAYREAFDGFDPARIIKYGPKKIEALMANAGIVRNRLKVLSVIENAKAYFQAREDFGTFDAYIWNFVNGEPIVNHWKSFKEVPASTKESDAMSKELKRRGFKFVGSTICYAFMQAVGMVNDHTLDCWKRRRG